MSIAWLGSDTMHTSSCNLHLENVLTQHCFSLGARNHEYSSAKLVTLLLLLLLLLFLFSMEEAEEEAE